MERFWLDSETYLRPWRRMNEVYGMKRKLVRLSADFKNMSIFNFLETTWYKYVEVIDA